jgi:hypothetical protein
MRSFLVAEGQELLSLVNRHTPNLVSHQANFLR